MGNLRSVQKAFEVSGCNAVISNKHDVIKDANKIVLPGVGSFQDGMKNLFNLDLIDILNQEVLKNKKPFLGICLGMHLIARKGYENGETRGLSWVDAEVIKFDFEKSTKDIKVPHVGWNSAKYANYNNLFEGVNNKSDFYFVHSYHFKTNEQIVTSTTNHGKEFVSSIQKDNIYAFQFHPEKSQAAGLKIIKNFIQC
jgi:imidazole glycerol-phosphate synthase subunit HisH